MSSPARHVIIVLVVFGLALGVYTSRVQIAQARAEYPSLGEVIYLPDNQILHLVSLGYKNALADLLWVQTVLYFAEHLSTDQKYHWLSTYIDAILSLDDRFKKVYKWAGVVTMYNTFNLSTFKKEDVELRPNRYQMEINNLSEEDAMEKLCLDCSEDISGDI